MTRITRLAAVAALVLALVLGLAACGGSDSSTTSTTSAAYTAAAATAVANVRAAGTTIATTMNGLSSQSDSQVAKAFDAIKTQATTALGQLKALKPPAAKDKTLVVAVVTPLTKAIADIGAMSDAADLSDSTKFNAATAKLTAVSPAVKAANNALGLSVGVPVPKDATATTATTATTGTTATDPNAPTSTKKEAGEAIVASGVALKHLGTTMSNGGKTSDKVFAKQLDKAGTEIAESQILVAGLKAPTAADQKLVDNLAAILKRTYADVAQLSLAAEHGDTAQGKSATTAIVADAGRYKDAVDALTKALSSSTS